MKRSLRVLISLCLSLVLMGCFSVGLSAKSYPVWVDGIQFTDSNRVSGIPCGNGTATLSGSGAPYTVTLNNAVINCTREVDYQSGYVCRGLLAAAACNVVLNGENTVYSDSPLSVECSGNITFTGNGTLRTAGIRSGGNTTVNGNCKLIADYMSAGGFFTLQNGYVNLSHTYSGSPALTAGGTIRILGGALDAESYYDRNVNVLVSSIGIEWSVPATYLSAGKSYVLDPSTVRTTGEKDFYGNWYYVLLGQINADSGTCYVQHVTFGNPYGAYADYPSWNWAEPYIRFAIDNELMYGVSERDFAASDSVTRAQLVTILYRLAGSPRVFDWKTPFADVPTNQWYSKAIAWAYQTGIASGYSDTVFGTNDKVKREDVVTFFWRYEKQPVSAGDLSAFTDADQVADYAKEALGWAVNEGIISGLPPALLDPEGTTTRAQLAKIISVYAKIGFPDGDWKNYWGL